MLTSPQPRRRKPWSPTSLRTGSLFAFMILFACLEGTLALLWTLNKRMGGFHPIANDDFGWSYRYGPTALFILIISFWRQVDYDAKILRPWQELERGDATADMSLLLDYVSPLALVAVWKAIRNRHGSVVWTGLGFFMLKALTVASTGLFSPTSTNVVLEVSATTKTAFNYTERPLDDQITLADTITYAAVDRAKLTLDMGLTFPEGVSLVTAYQQVAFPEIPNSKNTSFSTTVEALRPNVTCQKSEFLVSVTRLWNVSDLMMNTDGRYGEDEDRVALELSVTNSGLHDFTIEDFLIYDAGSIYGSDQDGAFVITGAVSCGNHNDTCIWTYSGLMLDDNAALAWNSKQSTQEQSSIRLDQIAQIQQETSLLCVLGIEKGFQDIYHQVSDGVKTITVGKFTPSSNSKTIELGLQQTFQRSLDVFQSPSWWSCFLKAVQNSSDTSNLLYSLDIPQRIELTITQILVQYLAGNMQASIAKTYPGTAAFDQPRIAMNFATAVMIGAGIGFMLAVTFTIWLRRPSLLSFQSKVDSISHVANVLRQSPQINYQLSSLRSKNTEERLQNLSCFVYSLRSCTQDTEGSTGIKRRRLQTVRSPRTSVEVTNQHWWQPWSIRSSALGCTLLLPAIIIGLLEVLQHVSDKHLGFVTINHRFEGLLRYIPAIAMLLVSSLFSALDFNAAVLAALVQLKRREQPGSTLKVAILGQLPPVALIKTLRHRMWGSFAASMAAFMGSLLTIIVAGLYSTQQVATQSDITMERVDMFWLEWDSILGNDNGASLVTSAIEGGNYSYPMFTYDDLVLPTIRASKSSNASLTNQSGTLSITLPALRANLNCDTSEGIEVFIARTVNTDSSQHVKCDGQVRVPFQQNCPKPTTMLNQSSISYPFEYNFATLPEGVEYFGRFFDMILRSDQPLWSYDTYLKTLPEYERNWRPLDDNYYQGAVENPPGCPSIGIVWGFNDYEANSTMVRSLLCTQEVQQVQARVTLNFPELTISTSDPPVVDETTIKLLHGRHDSHESFTWWVGSAFRQVDLRYGRTNVPLINGNTSTHPPYYYFRQEPGMDSFFESAVLGKSQLGLATLQSGDIDELMHGVQSTYRRFMTQLINNNMRRNINTTGTFFGQDQMQQYTKANLTYNTQDMRAYQQKFPKLILEFILGAMLLFGLVSVMTIRFERVVQWNPCSIAGAAALLAGSKICWSENKLKESEVDMRSDPHQILINQRTPLVKPTTVSPDREWTTAWKLNEIEGDFRLGWWKRGVYAGDSEPSAISLDDNGCGIACDDGCGAEWRYGIDRI